MASDLSPHLKLDDSGRLRLDSLDAALDVESALSWMAARFASRDPYLPLDEDSLEKPHALFDDLFRRAKVSHPKLTNVLSQALADFLDGAWRARQPPEGLAYALRLAHMHPPSPARALFHEVVQAAVESPPRDRLGHLWLEAAAAQPLSADVQPWRQLLGAPGCASAAYSALEQDRDLAVDNFSTFWQALSGESRQPIVRLVLNRLLRKHGDDLVKALAQRAISDSWSTDLIADVDESLRSLGRRSLFSPMSAGAAQPDSSAPPPSRRGKAKALELVRRVISGDASAEQARHQLLHQFEPNDDDARQLLSLANRSDAVELTGRQLATFFKYAPTVEKRFYRVVHQRLEVRSAPLVRELNRVLGASVMPDPPSRTRQSSNPGLLRPLG